MVGESGAILFEIKAAATIPDSIKIRAGYSANAEIVLARVENVLHVPENSIEFVGDSTFVYVLKSTTEEKQDFEKRPIRIGLSDGIKVEVKEGLSLDERIRGNEIFEKKALHAQK